MYGYLAIRRGCFRGFFCLWAHYFLRRALLFVDVALVQGHHHGDAQLQQLGGEKQAAAQVGGVHDVDDHIRMFLLHIGAGDALLAGEGGHGVGAGQVHGDELLLAAIVGLLDGVFLFLHRDARPVADPFIPAGEGVVHGGLTGVWIAGQSNSHVRFLP